MKQTLIHVKQTLANAPENVPSLSQTISFPRGRATYHATKTERMFGLSMYHV